MMESTITGIYPGFNIHGKVDDLNFSCILFSCRKPHGVLLASMCVVNFIMGTESLAGFLSAVFDYNVLGPVRVSIPLLPGLPCPILSVSIYYSKYYSLM